MDFWNRQAGRRKKSQAWAFLPILLCSLSLSFAARTAFPFPLPYYSHYLPPTLHTTLHYTHSTSFAFYLHTASSPLPFAFLHCTFHLLCFLYFSFCFAFALCVLHIHACACCSSALLHTPLPLPTPFEEPLYFWL